MGDAVLCPPPTNQKNDHLTTFFGCLYVILHLADVSPHIAGGSSVPVFERSPVAMSANPPIASSPVVALYLAGDKNRDSVEVQASAWFGRVGGRAQTDDGPCAWCPVAMSSHPVGLMLKAHFKTKLRRGATAMDYSHRSSSWQVFPLMHSM